MIGIWQRFHRNFELTVFELTVPDLYTKNVSENEFTRQTPVNDNINAYPCILEINRWVSVFNYVSRSKSYL